MHGEVINDATVARALKRAKAENRRIMIRDATIKLSRFGSAQSGRTSYSYQYRDGRPHPAPLRAAGIGMRHAEPSSCLCRGLARPRP